MKIYDSMRKKPIVALIYDFDGTLSPGNMQEFGFIQAIGKSPEEFWRMAAERGIPALVSSDAHRIVDLAAPFGFLESFASRIGLTLLEPGSISPLSFRKVQAN